MNLLDIYSRLSDEADGLFFKPPVDFVYNPLSYAWDGFFQYVKKSEGKKNVVFLGINPGPYGMAQTGVPFGEINAVKNFLGITKIDVHQPKNYHSSRPVLGLNCKRSEISGKRLWGLFSEKFTSSENFFMNHIVLNYCPLLFTALNEKGSARNITPDKISTLERDKLYKLCDEALREAVEIIGAKFVVAVGNFAFERAKSALKNSVIITKIIHPSPANPEANSDWPGKATDQLIKAGVWQ